MMSEVFLNCRSSLETDGELTYEVTDYAFDFRPAGVAEPVVLLFGSIQVEVDSTGRCRYAWGYSPYQGWSTGNIPELPAASHASCLVDGELEPGDVLVVTEPADTATTIDPGSGFVWVRSRSQEMETYDWAHTIAPGVTLLGWDGGKLGGLLLRPSNVEAVLEAMSRL